MRKGSLLIVLVGLAVLLTVPNSAWAQDIEMPEGFRIDCVRMYSGEGVGAPPPRFGIDRGQHFIYWLGASVDSVTFCDAFFRPNHAVVTCDANSNGMIDSWELAIVGAVLCNSGHPLYASVEAAFQAHIAQLESELNPIVAGNPDHIHDYMAAHMLCSTAACDFWVNYLTLGGTYAPFTVGPDEPLSPGGDLDGDGATNQEEYENIRAAGWFGWRSAFYEAVADDTDDGTIALPATGRMGLGFLAGACVIVGAFVIAAAYAVQRSRVRIGEQS